MRYDPARWKPVEVPSRLETYAREVVIQRPPADVFAFSVDVQNFPKIVPIRVTPAEGLDVPDFRYDYVYPGNFWVNRCVRIRYVAHVVKLVQDREFVDVQLWGPFRYLRHTHLFEPVGSGTLYRDVLEYATHLGGVLDRTLVRRLFARLLAYRHRMMKRLLEAA